MNCVELRAALLAVDAKDYGAYMAIWWPWAKAHPAVFGKSWPGVCPVCQ